MNKWLLRFLLLAVVLAVALAVFWWRTGPVTVEVAQARIGPAVQAVYASGTVEPTVMMPIAPKISGRLDELLVDESAQVVKGQKLAAFDSEELVQSVREWEARVRFAQNQYDRAASLLARGVGTGVARDSARHDLDTAKAALARIRKQTREMVLYAPEAGRIIRRDGEVGQVFSAGQALFWMACCAPLRVSVEVDEEDIPKVVPGQKVLIQADAYPDRVLEGTVSEITPKGDPVARSFRVRIRLPEDTPLLIGMTADCNIIADEKPNAVLVPATAINEGKVWLVKDGKAQERAVVTGASGNGWTEIKSGVTRDDTFVVSPDDRLNPGREVKARRAGTN
ncbi:efflux RND transporter periplasmic adaptor subunit [Emcibacter sp. SYSU 3D8]|uniref:efflux RND transporter periplasmic adaptor subunit n=1 Tax=Emcibacter sp. SYSU 3D8 TaxID=3133969 RepID=UPI0031FEC0B5